MTKGEGRPHPVGAALVRRLDTTGLAVGLIFWAASLRPTLLPRTWLVQGALCALAALVGYGLGVLGAVIAKRLAQAASWSGPDRAVVAWTRRALLLAWLVVLVLGPMLWLGWQNTQRDLVTMERLTASAAVLVVPVGLVAFFVLLVPSRLIGYVVRWIDRTLTALFTEHLPHALTAPADPGSDRHIDVPRILAAGVTTLLVVVGGLAFSEDFLGDELIEYTNAKFGSFDTTTAAGVEQPTSPLVSGSPESKADWDSLGYEGRNFVAGSTTLARLATFGGPGTEPKAPIRLYAGLRSAGTNRARADLVVEDLERTGASSRAVLCVVTATGTGWVDPVAAAGLEYLWKGDTAIVSTQYSYLPSWISFLVDSDEAAAAGRVLNEVVFDWWLTLPEGQRPKLVVFGESLGSFGSEGAFAEGTVERSMQAASTRADAVLWVGPTNANPVWGQVEANRDMGTPVWQPIYRRGEPVRFMTGAGTLRPSGQWSGSRVLYVQHGTDPVTWWDLETAWAPPPWLDDPRGPGVTPDAGWFPIVTWMQVVADLMAGFSAPAGYGHNYNPDLADAWATVLPPSGWTDVDTARLAEVLDGVAQANA